MSADRSDAARPATGDDDTAALYRAAHLADPDQIDDIAMLREELQRANRAVLRLGAELAAAQDGLREVGRELARIVVPYLRGDDDAARAELASFVARRVKIAASPPGGLQ